MDFITWWFQSHDILSTILTPGLSVLYSIYTDNAFRFIIAFIIWIFFKGVILNK